MHVWQQKQIGIAALESLPIPKVANLPFLLIFLRPFAPGLIAMLLMILQVLRLAGLLAISLHSALLIDEKDTITVTDAKQWLLIVVLSFYSVMSN